ncbi:MAG TPA: hypothetical protein VFV73_29315 [Streptosporangiaceae bacterium]|nr:hypothetical protein [Streptosporangiaceae bacterium]
MTGRALADLGFTGLDPDPGDPVIITGYKTTATRKTTPAQRHANQALSAARAPAGHGFTDLKNWRIITRLVSPPARRRSCCTPCSSSPASTPPADRRS